MTVADLLTDMGALNNELDIAVGGTDEVRSVNLLNIAVDYVEAVAASLPHVLSVRGVNPIPTVANIESSIIPAELLRIDKLWMLDPSTSLPLFPMARIYETGGHQPSVPWPLNYIVNATSTGMPRSYYPDASHLYWNQVPDQVYNVRAYGLWAAERFTDRNSPLPPHWPDSLAVPLAAFAVKYGNLAVADPTDDIQKIAVEFFTPVLRSLRRRDRSSPPPRQYQYNHTT